MVPFAILAVVAQRPVEEYAAGPISRYWIIIASVRPVAVGPVVPRLSYAK
jgi:hypothetical protein